MRRMLIGILAVLALGAPVWGQGPNKLALLIGVNDYTKGPDSWDLRGCVNDVKMTREVLINKYGFPADNIKTLIDAEATAVNIVAAIEDWLIARSRPEDIVYFHFSGHGSQTRDEEQDEEDLKDELICPTDMQVGVRSSVITDDQLKELFSRILALNVTIVIDACHSGTSTRDIGLSQKRMVEFEEGLDRLVVMTAKPGGQSTTAQPEAEADSQPAAEPVKVEAAQKPANQSQLAGSGGMEGNKKQQVSIAGCRPDQTSADAWIKDDFYAGALTYHLIENMKKAPPDMTYKQLMDRVVRDIKAKKYSQIPQIEGDMDRPILGTVLAETVTDAFVVVQTVEGKRVKLNAGKAQNVTVGSVYAAFGPSETKFDGLGMGRIKIVEVGQLQATAEVIDDFKPQKGYRLKEVLHHLNADKLNLLVECSNAQLKASVLEHLSEVDFVAAVGPEKHFDHRLRIDLAGTGLKAALTVDGVPSLPVTGDDAEWLVKALLPQLENAYAIKYLANLDNPNPEFNVEVWANRAADKSQLAAAPNEKMIQAKVDELVRFNFKADRDCYLTLINVGTSGKISVLFPNDYQENGFVKAGQVYRTGTPGTMPFQIRIHPPTGRELVKAIATLEPLDLSSLKMGKDNGLGTRLIKSGSSFAQQLARDLALEALPGAEASASAGGDATLLPTDRWATDYLFIETSE